jgi:hypothetical protein
MTHSNLAKGQRIVWIALTILFSGSSVVLALRLGTAPDPILPRGAIPLHSNLWCAYIGRYGPIVIEVNGTIFERRWPRKEQYRDVLIAADYRAIAAIVAGDKRGE